VNLVGKYDYPFIMSLFGVFFCFEKEHDSKGVEDRLWLVVVRIFRPDCRRGEKKKKREEPT